MSSKTTYHVQGKGINATTLTRKHELFNSFVTTRNGILQCKLGATRGRAMAMLMDSQYECSDVDEVHIVLGPGSDLKVRMKSDEDLEDDPRTELFEDDIIPHMYLGSLGRRVMLCASPCQLNFGTDDSSWTQAVVMT